MNLANVTSKVKQEVSYEWQDEAFEAGRQVNANLTVSPLLRNFKFW